MVPSAIRSTIYAPRSIRSTIELSLIHIKSKIASKNWTGADGVNALRQGQKWLTDQPVFTGSFFVRSSSKRHSVSAAPEIEDNH